MKIFFSFLLFVRATFSQEDLLCSTSFCEQYLLDNTCRDVPQNCNYRNGTHSGIFLPFPGPCNCCDYCLENLNEGDACPMGTAGSTVPSIICGSGLSCTLIDGETRCYTMVTECTTAQAEYDERRQNGQLGHLEERPACDRNGLYEPYKCIPGEICHCMSEKGERLFGDVPFTSMPQHVLNCKCSRAHRTASETVGEDLHPGEFLRCRSDGNYDPLQCIDDLCFCVHPSNGSPASFGMNFVNLTLISNETLQCFNNDTHVEGKFYRECEARYIEILEEIEEYEEMGFEVFGYVFPNCQLDGYYGAVQKNGTHAYCADPNNKVLEDFVVDLTDALVLSMDCKCARSRSIAAFDKPDCLRNGNYDPFQCRRGYCRCVDDDGNQIEKEMPVAHKEALSCYDSGEVTTTEAEDLE